MSDRASSPNVRLHLEFNLNRDVTVVTRQVYNSFQLLGDVGGIYGLLISLSSTILGILNYQKAENILV